MNSDAILTRVIVMVNLMMTVLVIVNSIINVVIDDPCELVKVSPIKIIAQTTIDSSDIGESNFVILDTIDYT